MSRLGRLNRQCWWGCAWIQDASLIIGGALLVLGCILIDLPWHDFGVYARDSIILVLAVLLFGGAVALAMRVHKAWAFMLAGIMFPALLWGGLSIVLATLMVIFTGAAIGTFFNRHSGLSPVVRWVAGIGVLAAVAGWLLPWPVHSSITWFSAGALLIGLRWRPLTEDVARFVHDTRAAVASSPIAASSWAILVSLVAAPAWLPARNIDDLAYHLNLGAELIRFGHATFDVGVQSWAMAPWLADVVHALVSVIAGKQAYGPINAWWLIVTGLLVRELAVQMGMSSGRAWLLSALYLSLPLTSFLTGSMQTEAITPAIFAALAVAIQAGSDKRAQQLPVIAALSGFLLGAKVASALLLIPMGVWLVVAWRRDFPWHALTRSVLLGVFVCGSSYLYAGLLTGNPVLPVLNGWFQSPWFPVENFVDLTWQTGLRWDLPWELVFSTPRYFEAISAGAAGVVTLLLLVAVIPAVLNKHTRAAALVSIAALLLVLSQVQYLRYAHPAFALFVPAVGAAVLRGEAGWGWREGLIAVSVCVQAFLIPTSSWMLSARALRTFFLDGATAVTDQFVPEREVVARLRNDIQETDRVLFLDPLRSQSAELPGQSVGTAWFTPLMSSIRARMPRTAKVVEAEVLRSGANYLLIYDAAQWPEALAYIDKRRAVRVDHNGAGELYWLPPPAPVSLSSLVTDVQIRKPYPVVGQAAVRVACNKPGEAVAVAWQLPIAPKGTVGSWEWVVCGANRYAVSAIQFSAGADAEAIRLTLAPAQPERGMILGAPMLVLDVRRDYQAQTALYRALWAPFCHYLDCKSTSPNVSTLEHGPLLLKVNEQGADSDSHE